MGEAGEAVALFVRSVARTAFVCVAALLVTGVISGAGSVARGEAAESTVTLPPIPVDADAYVDSANSNKNYGPLPTLRVDGSSPVQRSFLRFDLSGVTGTVTKATLWIYAESSQTTGYSVYGVSNTTWGENTITDSNAPGMASSATGSSGPASINTWTRVVVTPLVSAAVGHKVSFGFKTTSPTALKMTSNQGATANRPYLSVETTAAGDTQAPTTPSGLTANASSPTRIDLSWNASTDDVGVTGYSIYKDGGTTPAATVTGTSYSDTVTPTSTHSYQVDAFDAVGNHSIKTAPTPPVTTPDAPGCRTSANGSAYSVTLCLTSPQAGQVAGNVLVTATVATNSLNGQQVTARATVVFCLDAAAATCPDGGSGYLLSDYPATGKTTYGFTLPTNRWVDGAHALTARVEMSDGFASPQPTPPVSLTFSNGVTTPPPNGNSFTPRSGTPPQPGQPLVVAAVGDGAAGESFETAVVNQIAGWNPNLFLYLGDVYEKGSPSEFFNYYGSANTVFGRFASITNPTVGNHEYSFDSQASGYFNFWDMGPTRHNYSFDAGGWHFISLDSTSQYNGPGTLSTSSPTYAWLQQDLAADTSPCTLVYYHHPVWNIGPEGPTTRFSPVWSLLVAHGGVLVLNGHDHDYQRYDRLDTSGNLDPNGVVEIVAGGGGHSIQQTSPSASGPQPIIKEDAHFGALQLLLSPTSATINYWTINNTSTPFDTSTFTCNPPPPPPPPAPTLTLTALDGNDYVNTSSSTVFYNPNASTGSFKVDASSTGATSMQYPPVFSGGDGGTVTPQPFSKTYTWGSGASTAVSVGVTASNGSATSPPTPFTVRPDSTAPSTSILCNSASCAGSFTSTVTVSFASSDGAGSGVASTFYTTDGSDPTTSQSRTLYSGSFPISATATVRYYAIDSLGTAEAPQSQTVTINSAPAGIAYVQQQQASGSSGTLTAALSPTQSGDTLVAVVALAAGSSSSVQGITDSSGIPWNKAAAVIGYLTGTNSRVEIWYRTGVPAVTNVTVTISPAKSAAVNVTEWSGVAAVSQPDQSRSGNGASTTTVSTATPFTTGNATDLVIAATNYPGAAMATLTTPGWSTLPAFTSGSSVHGNVGYVITTTAGIYQATWSLNASSGGHGTAILALKGT